MQVNVIRDTLANLTAQNAVLAENEISIETDFEGLIDISLGRIKVGNGIYNWKDLTYLVPAIPLDLSRQVDGLPASSSVILRFVAARSFTLSASGHQGYAATAATAQADFTVKVNAVLKSTLRFGAGGTISTIIGGTAAAVAIGDIVTITSPVQDVTLADLTFTLRGTS